MRVAQRTTQRVYVQMVDPDRRQPGRSLTVYDATPAEAHERIERLLAIPEELLAEFERFVAARQPKTARRRDPVPA